MTVPKYFNTTGLCEPERHYMVNPYRGLKGKIMNLINRHQYFVLHAPRQTGKTTLLRALAHELNAGGQYIGLVTSLESAGYQTVSIEATNYIMLKSLHQSAKRYLPEAYQPPLPEKGDSLESYIGDWCQSQQKPIVLLLDEIDALYNDVLISTLRQLRNGFQRKPEGFPASIALVGLRDVREFKEKVRTVERSLGSGSPFNIKAESFMMQGFNLDQVYDLLQQHTEVTGQVFPDEVIESIYHLCNGQPWLTNALAKEIVDEVLEFDNSRPITMDVLHQAKENLIDRRDTHLNSLVDKLREERLKNVVIALLTGEAITYDDYDDSVRYARDLGLIITKPQVAFANAIYKEVVIRSLNYNYQVSFHQELADSQWYVKKDGKLDMDALLKAFIVFYQRHSENWLQRYAYQEVGPQLLLMAFLQRVISTGGAIHYELAAGSGRSDLSITWQGEYFVIELKLNHGIWVRDAGLQQTARYMEQIGAKRGYLFIFDRRPPAQHPWPDRLYWHEETHEDHPIAVIGL